MGDKGISDFWVIALYTTKLLVKSHFYDRAI